jgi:hypothetical protein
MVNRTSVLTRKVSRRRGLSDTFDYMLWEQGHSNPPADVLAEAFNDKKFEGLVKVVDETGKEIKPKRKMPEHPMFSSEGLDYEPQESIDDDFGIHEPTKKQVALKGVRRVLIYGLSVLPRYRRN